MSYTNAQCAHIWAQQEKEQGKTNNGNVFFIGKTIYSYGYHFPMGVFLNKDTVVLNSDSYSISTSGQQSDVYQATRHITNRIFVDTVTIKVLSKGNELTLQDRDRISTIAQESAKKHCKRACTRRKENLRMSDYGTAVNKLNTAINIIKFFKLHVPKKLYDFIDTIKNDKESLAGKFEKEIKAKRKKEAAQKKKHDAYRALMQKEAIAKFRAGERFIRYNMPRDKQLLRVKDHETIETSDNASFPIEHAKKAFPLIKSCKDNKCEFVTNGKQIRVGHFKIDNIDIHGNLKAGCHYIEYSEIERTAKTLGLI